jgi:2-C-methyl-D-erythritol 4-phosphate cytidylyltransferase
MHKYAIIVAGGKGTRMQSPVPKQFLEIDGTPIIVLTIRKFLQYDPKIGLIVVLPSDHLRTWKVIQQQYFNDVSLQTAEGGDTRFDSVKAGLSHLPEHGLVAIHDAVRPFVSIRTIGSSFLSAEGLGSGVAAVLLKDSIREITIDGSRARRREDFRIVQTPQTFRLEEIKQAFRQARRNTFTDDASVYEAAGFSVSLVEGSYENKKITTPDDLS